MREYIAQVPSSPSMALFKGNELKYFMPREHIEGRDIQEICLILKTLLMNTVTNIRITTAVKTNASLYKQVEDAFSVLSQLESIQNVQIIKRRKLTINQLFQRDTTPLIVFESSGPKLYFTPDTPIYFHLDTVKVKLHMMKQHKMPVLIEMLDEITTGFKTFNFIDGTMGFGRDTYLILKHYQQANVYAIEQNPLIHYVISEGMKRYLTEDELSRIHYINDDYHH